MRMWLVNPKILCRQHLLGEHLEMHMFYSSLLYGKNLWGYVNKNLFEAEQLFNRHNQLVEEMISRGYNHKSPIETEGLYIVENNIILYKKYKINKFKALDDLLNRCERCKNNFNKMFE